MEQALTTRRLPPAEFDRLDAFVRREISGIHQPDHVIVPVVEDAEGAIVASALLMPTVLTGAVWIAPEHRGEGAAARHLLRWIAGYLSDVGAAGTIVFSPGPSLDAYLTRLGGAPTPWRAWLLPMLNHARHQGPVQ